MLTGHEVRRSCREGTYTSYTSGQAPSYVQANLIVLPSKYANDFRLLCRRNPVPCPLLAESSSNGTATSLKSHIPGISSGSKIASDIDLRRDCPRYMVYQDGRLVESHVKNVSNNNNNWWDTIDHVGFLIGCSYSFETALAQNGLVPPHVKHGRNVPMYRTEIPLLPAGVFQGATYVVSMRFYKKTDIDKVREITRPYVLTHGEPIDWGWEAVKRLKIQDLWNPEWGDTPVSDEGNLALVDGKSTLSGGGGGGVVEETEEEQQSLVVPVFWGCGITSQEAVMRANLDGVVLAHAPGHMMLLDICDEDILL